MTSQVVDDFKDYTIDSFSIKPTLGCNMRCDYCYCHNGAEDLLRQSGMLSEDTLRRLLSSYATLVREGSKYVSQGTLPIVWHGGEPLKVGVQAFEKYLEVQKGFEQDLDIQTIIQTNATLINDEWIDLFKRHHISIGISLDGDEKTHNTHRKLDNGTGSYRRIEEIIGKLRENEIPFGTVGVITGKNVCDAKDTYDHMKRLGISFYDFTPAIFDGAHECALSGRGYAEFYSHLFDVWNEDGVNRPEIKMINDIVSVIRLEKGFSVDCPPVLCEFAGKCGNALSVLPNGDIFPCECLVNVPRLRLGNIGHESLGTIIEGEPFKKFVAEFNAISPQCFSCKWFKVCNGGCFHRRLPECNGNKGHDFFCAGRKVLFKHIWERVQ